MKIAHPKEGHRKLIEYKERKYIKGRKTTSIKPKQLKKRTAFIEHDEYASKEKTENLDRS